MEQWLADIFQPPVISAGGAFVGVIVGAILTGRGQKRQRQQQFVRDQLVEFYSPMLGLRAQILAKSELRLKISGVADSAWLAVVEGVRDAGPAEAHRVSEERFQPFEKIIEHDNRSLAEEILPAYRKMLELFTAKMHFAEFSTLQHYADLLEFIEIWTRWLDKSLPPEVLKGLKHSEKTLHPFYADLAHHFGDLQRRLKEQSSWTRWRRRETIKVLPSR